jgi:Ca2+-transporting ATPase
LPQARRAPWWRLVAGQVRDPLILVLPAAVVLTIATGDLADASVIVLVIAVNTAVGVTQEVKASQAIAALSDLAAAEARVLRDSGKRQIPAAEAVIEMCSCWPRATSCPPTPTWLTPRRCWWMRQR